jgi:hypothetical protein
MNYLYKYLFYKILVFAYWVKTRNTQEWSAMIIVSILLFINCDTLYSIALLYMVRGSNYLVSPFYNVFFGGIIMALNYSYFVKDDKYLLIKKEFEKESVKEKWISTGLVLMYLILTCFSWFYFAEKVRDINIRNKNSPVIHID